MQRTQCYVLLSLRHSVKKESNHQCSLAQPKWHKVLTAHQWIQPAACVDNSVTAASYFLIYFLQIKDSVTSAPSSNSQKREIHLLKGFQLCFQVLTGHKVLQKLLFSSSRKWREAHQTTENMLSPISKFCILDFILTYSNYFLRLLSASKMTTKSSLPLVWTATNNTYKEQLYFIFSSELERNYYKFKDQWQRGSAELAQMQYEFSF